MKKLTALILVAFMASTPAHAITGSGGSVPNGAYNFPPNIPHQLNEEKIKAFWDCLFTLGLARESCRKLRANNDDNPSKK